MTRSITIICENNHTVLEVAEGSTLSEIAHLVGCSGKFPYLAAYVNNRIRDMHAAIYRPSTIRFVDITSYAGFMVYQRTISFILHKATRDIFPQNRLHIRHSLGYGGLYCELEGMGSITCEQATALRTRMREIVAADYPITTTRLPTEQVKELYQKLGYEDKIALLQTRPRLYSTISQIDDTISYFFGALAPSSGYIAHFDLQPSHNGFSLLLPARENPAIIVNSQQDKMFSIFSEYHQWVNLLGVPTVGALNAKVMSGETSELLKIGEALHEKRLSKIADQIVEAQTSRGVRMALISGPSSSGKTTTAKRLGIHLQVLGLSPLLISLDDYFVDRDKTPLDENGEYDYEALEAIDLAKFNDDLQRLFAGESVDIPRYDFISGTRKWHDAPLTLSPNSILIIEGIHGLNPKLTPLIEDSLKFKIYVSCITSIALDNTTRIPTTDNRLLRRLTRDYTQRGSNGMATLARWESVRRGEERHIFPYQEQADVMFNSSLFYEISVLRQFVEPILHEVPDTVPEYNEARRLLKFLDSFVPIKECEIPSTSLLREFIGGSSFK